MSFFYLVDIRMILNDQTQLEKYEDFMVRRVLAVEPDARWCPAPDCSFAVIASGCASCPKLRCERPGCDSYFCYHCKAQWHPNQTCDAARAQRSQYYERSSSLSFSQTDSQHSKFRLYSYWRQYSFDRLRLLYIYNLILLRRRHKTMPEMPSSDCQNGRWKLQSYDVRGLWRGILLALYERNH